MLVVKSKVKEYVKKQESGISTKALEALDNKVMGLLDTATHRAKANKRKYVQPQDI